MTFLEEIEKLVSEEPNNMELGKKIRNLFSEEEKWIYERNPDTGQVFRRKPGESYEKRQEVDSDSNPIARQLELFPFKV